jgi:hypothetical protein
MWTFEKGYPMGYRPFVLYLCEVDFIHWLLKKKKKKEKHVLYFAGMIYA